MVYKTSNPEFKELRELDENLEVEWEKIDNVYEMNDNFFEKMDKMDKKLLRRLEERWLKVGAENHQSKEDITRLKEEITQSVSEGKALRADNASLIEEKTVHRGSQKSLNEMAWEDPASDCCFCGSGSGQQSK
ncbi:hypothetical protein SLS54_001554 [Diplodia seriata]